MSDVTATAAELAALQQDINERFTNLVDQMNVLKAQVAAMAESSAIKRFPDELEQIRVAVREAFAEEIAQFTNRLNTLETQVAQIRDSLDLD